MFNCLKRTQPKTPAEPMARWLTVSETEHFVHLQLNVDGMPMSFFEELHGMNLHVITFGQNPMRDYKFDFYCEKFDYTET